MLKETILFLVLLSLYCVTVESSPANSRQPREEDEDGGTTASRMYSLMLDAGKHLIDDTCEGLMESGNALYTQVKNDNGYDSYAYGSLEENPNVNLPRTNIAWFAPKSSRLAQDYSFARLSQANCNLTRTIFSSAIQRVHMVRECIVGRTTPYALLFGLDDYAAARVHFSEAFIATMNDVFLMRSLLQTDTYKNAPLFKRSVVTISKTIEAKASMALSIAKVLEAHFPKYIRLLTSCTDMVRNADTLEEKISLLNLNWHGSSTDHSQLRGPIRGFAKAFQQAKDLEIKAVSRYDDLDNVLLGMEENDDIEDARTGRILVGNARALPDFVLCPLKDKEASYPKYNSFKGCGFAELVTNDKAMKKRVRQATKRRLAEIQEEKEKEKAAKRRRLGELSDSEEGPSSQADSEEGPSSQVSQVQGTDDNNNNQDETTPQVKGTDDNNSNQDPGEDGSSPGSSSSLTSQ